jgi:Domain of unknown function (DUF4442)
MTIDRKTTFIVRMWALRNVLLLWLVRPRIVEVDDRRCEMVIPLNWRTRRRDIRAMYLGTLCMGADIAGGLIAFQIMMRTKEKMSFVFKDIRGEFLKRAEDDVHFVCEDGAMIQQMVERARSSGERAESTVRVVARVPKKLGDEPVAIFELTLSVKKR